MTLKFREESEEDADLDVTSFMNLMIVLVPVLLLSMTFTQISTHDIKLPDLSKSSSGSAGKESQLNVKISEETIKVYYPENRLIHEIEAKKEEEGMVHDFAMLSSVMQGVKEQLKERRDVTILVDGKTNYQTLVSAMDAVKSYKMVVATELVEAELFPEVSLGES